MLKIIPKSWSQFQPPWDLGSGGTNDSDLLCLQAENISDLEFRVASSGLKSMCNFSQRQSLQVSVTGLNVGIFVLRNFQVMIGLWPAVFSLR